MILTKNQKSVKCEFICSVQSHPKDVLILLVNKLQLTMKQNLSRKSRDFYVDVGQKSIPAATDAITLTDKDKKNVCEWWYLSP